MLRDLHVGHVAYAAVNLWATLLGAAICLPIGALFDRAGLRATTAVLTVLLAAAVWAMSTLSGGIAALFLLVLATRTLGQSALSVASITAVGKSFDRQVGMAMGVYAVLLTVFFAAAFTAVGTSVRLDGWRTAWARVAIGLLLAAPASLLLRDGGPGAMPPEAGDQSAGVSLADALRTPAFWIFAGATALFGLVSSGLGLFNEAVLAERGFDQQTYVAFLTTTAAVGLAGQMLCGWLTMRWAMTRLLTLAMAIYAAALAGLPLLTARWHLWTVAVLVGLSGGMISVIFFAVWRRAFGARHLGRIQGAAQMLTVLASAIGPLVFAQSAARTGSYFPALWVLAPCVLICGLAAQRVTLPDVHPSPEVHHAGTN
jgi:MFS family permease